MFAANQPGESSITNRNERENQLASRRFQLLKTVSLTSSILFFLSWVLTWASYFSLDNIFYIEPTEIISFAGGIGSLIVYLILLQLSNSKLNKAKITNLGSFGLLLVIIGTFFGLNIVNYLSTSSRIIQAAFLVPLVLASLLGLKEREIIFVSILSYILLIGGIIIQALAFPGFVDSENLSPVYFFNWALLFSIIGFTNYIFTKRLRQAARNLEEQTDNLLEVVLKLNNTTEFGANLSSRLASITAELHATTNQHASTSQEQLKAIEQIAVSLEKLSETSSQIASSTQQAVQSADHMLEIALEVNTRRMNAETFAEEGNKAATEALESVSFVHEQIGLLSERLDNLIEQTNQINNVIDLLNGIADETHLLALNASIEVAGIGQNIYTESVLPVQGERFGVIAQEVKKLADHSRQATREVSKTIATMQAAVANASRVSEGGKNATIEALKRSEVAGKVIEQLNLVIQGSASLFASSIQASKEVKQRCETIENATGQQYIANRQIATLMQMSALNSQQSMEKVSQLSNTASQVNQQIDELNLVLAQATLN